MLSSLTAGNPHYYHAADGLEFVYMHFDGSNSHEICQHLLRFRGPLIRSSNNILIYNLIYNTVKFYENGEIEHMIDTSMRVYKLIRYLHENAAYEPHNETPVEKTIHYIRDHIDKKISLRNLAEVANLSEYYFTRYFKAQTGYTPIEYATMAKLDHAKVLLIRTDMTIREIAASVGYHNSNGFTNLFKDKIGCSPQMFLEVNALIPLMFSRISNSPACHKLKSPRLNTQCRTGMVYKRGFERLSQKSNFLHCIISYCLL